MKPKVILIPGILCDARVWRDQCIALEGKADIAVADVTEDDGLDLMAERLLREAPDHFALAGHSMGGRVALEVYCQAPERVTHLALMSTGFRGVQPGEADRRMKLIEAARQSGTRAVADQMLVPSMHPEKQRDAGLVEDLAMMLERSGVEALKRQFHALLTREDRTALLPDIDRPTLILCGREDSYSPLSRHLTMAERIPGAHLEIIEKAGHMAPMEEPQAVTRAMTQWLGL